MQAICEQKGYVQKKK